MPKLWQNVKETVKCLPLIGRLAQKVNRVFRKENFVSDEVKKQLRIGVDYIYAADVDRYAYIRWSLVEFYRDAGRTDQARAQAQALLAMTHPVDRRMWTEEYRPAAEALIKNLAAP